jgi:hypothetical protein
VDQKVLRVLTMTDRELLERAAKAAGIEVFCDGRVLRDCTGMHPASNVLAAPAWRPLTDDGDALRLAVKLNLWEPVMFGRRTEIAPDGDIYAATRRAIVRAAATLADGEPT